MTAGPEFPPPDPRRQSLARTVLAVLLVAAGACIVREFLPAMAWAAVFAIGTWSLYRRARPHVSRGRHDVALPLLATLAAALVFVLPLGVALVQFGREAHGMMEWTASARANGIAVPEWVSRLPWVSARVSSWWTENLSTPAALSDSFGRIDRSSTMLAGRHLGVEILHRATTFAFMLMTLFFLYKEGESLAAKLMVASERAFGPHGRRVAVQMVASIHGTVNGLVLVGFGEGVLLGACYLAAGVPHAVLLGGFTAVAAMIPFGAPVAFLVAAALLLAKGSTAAAVAVVVAGFVVSGVADHFVRPVLIGGSTHLPFLWVLFSILGGVGTLGLLGLFVGPAVMAILILLWREWTDPAACVEDDTAQVPAATPL